MKSGEEKERGKREFVKEGERRKGGKEERKKRKKEREDEDSDGGRRRYKEDPIQRQVFWKN